MDRYGEELKRHCIMMAIKRKQEEEKKIEEELNALFHEECEQVCRDTNALPVLLLIGGVLWIIDQIDRIVRGFLAVSWVKEYICPFLTVGNFLVLIMVWLFIRYMRGGGGEGNREYC